MTQNKALIQRLQEASEVRPKTFSHPNGHPSDGMTTHVDCGDGAVMTIIDPRSFEDGGPEWVMRYGNPESIRYTVASLLSSYDYLCSGHITMADATRRLRLMRQARRECIAALSTKEDI